ncbi:MAG: DUF1122 family protein [Ignisphaera sp.]|uniref:DUF1122 domain-containing protein n=1 Tax=Ignisphaera aggregans TaxID=334771 RepID=A0A7C4JLK1_9CREN
MLCIEILDNIDGVHVDYIVKDGRFPEEKNIEVRLVYKDKQRRLLIIKVFYGRPPYYRRWIEVFSINRELNLNNKIFKFVDSEFEEKLINCLASFLEGGERLFIDYMYDYETRKALELGVPPPLTRLGYILLKNGFTWFKDWYYPEGFMEGNPKLQAEKPVDENSRRKHLEEICREIKESMDRIKGLASLTEYLWIAENIIKRVEYLSKVCGNL